jgi:hypothetical protein
MSKSIETTSETAQLNLDGFDTFTNESGVSSVDQEDFAPSPRVIQGDRIKFSKQGIWVDDNKQPLPTGLLLLVYNTVRLVQKWTPDGMLAGPPYILGPNEKWPDVDAWNKKCPESEWRMYYDKLIGPYQKQMIVYFWNPLTMNKYTWAASSNSAMACVSDLAEKIKMKRAFKRARAYPLVTLGSLLWSKRYNTPGPNLIVQPEWLQKDESGALLPLVETPALAGPKPTTTVQEVLNRLPGMKVVPPVTGKEATGDEIKF